LKLTPIRQSVLLGLYGSAALACAPAAFAQNATGPVANDATIQNVTIVGSRRVGNTSATDTPVPVDYIPLTKAAEQSGQFDLAQTLANISPSFNSTRQTGADGADLIDSAALRGLGSDQTLVLMNGKRRHTTALVNLFGARNRGNTGTDMNAIPVLAIKDVQVLRDGAAAQYGSDAIAGVIDVELRKDLGCEAVAGFGEYSRHDGKNWLASAYCGVAVADGVLGITGEYYDRGRSNRSDPGSLRIIGDTKSKNETVYVNGEFPVGPGKLYLTAGARPATPRRPRGRAAASVRTTSRRATRPPCTRTASSRSSTATSTTATASSATAPASANGPAISRRPMATTACATTSRTRSTRRSRTWT